MLADPTSSKKCCTRCGLSAVGFLIFFLFFAMVLFSLLKERPSTQTSARAMERAKILEDIRSRSTQELTQPAWIDKEKQVVRLPIELAMDLTLAELEAKPLAAGAPIQITPSLIVPPYLKSAATPVVSSSTSVSPQVGSPPTSTPASTASPPPHPSSNPTR